MDAACDGPKLKKPRLFMKTTLPNHLEKSALERLERLSLYLKFGVVKLGEKCNAVKSKRFTLAECDASIYKTGKDTLGYFQFNDLFSKGFDLLRAVADESREIEKAEETALIILNKYLQNIEEEEQSLAHVIKGKGGKSVTETDVTVALTTHLMEKLSPGQSSTIDCHMNGKRKCQCSMNHCMKEAKFGATGIGNSAVWHGYPDVVFDSYGGLSSITVAATVIPDTSNSEYEDDEEDGEGDESPRGKTISEDQAYAQTIVFSFIQKKCHPHFNNYLIPNIVISPKEFRIIMYDSENDILICSGELRLFTPYDSLSIPSVIFLWMVLHYRLFCVGIDKSRIVDLQAVQSNFKKVVGDKLHLYTDCSDIGLSRFAPHQEEPMPSMDFLQAGDNLYNK